MDHHARHAHLLLVKKVGGRSSALFTPGLKSLLGLPVLRMAFLDMWHLLEHSCNDTAVVLPFFFFLLLLLASCFYNAVQLGGNPVADI